MSTANICETIFTQTTKKKKCCLWILNGKIALFSFHFQSTYIKAFIVLLITFIYKCYRSLFLLCDNVSTFGQLLQVLHCNNGDLANLI